MIDANFLTTVAAGFMGGLATGGILFATLGWNSRLFAGGRVLAAFAAQVLRLAIAAAMLAALVRLGAGALVAAMAGILIARGWTLRHMLGGRQ